MQTYKRHERSREAIELAYDSILQERMKVRHKYGFQPPRRGRKSDLQGDPLVSSHLLADQSMVAVDLKMHLMCLCSSAKTQATLLVASCLKLAHATMMLECSLALGDALSSSLCESNG